MKEKIAILTDSGSDVSHELAQELGIFVVALQVNYKNKSYLDGVTISAQEIYERLDTEVPSTSLPTGETVDEVLQSILQQGYTHILAIVLSSGLSGTYNLLRLMADECKIPMQVIDTKNIGIGSGLSVVKAAHLVNEGLSYEAILNRMPKIIENTKVFFVLDTLKYLQLGGRIGKVTALVGYALDLKPIITCDQQGIYTTISKARGRKVSLLRCMETALQCLEGSTQVAISIAHGNALADAQNIQKLIQARYPETTIHIGPVSPALGVHTGPGLIGIAVQRDC